MWIWRHLGQIPVFFDIYIYIHGGNGQHETEESQDKPPDDDDEAQGGLERGPGRPR